MSARSARVSGIFLPQDGQLIDWSAMSVAPRESGSRDPPVRPV
jgi:hypothetical protein